MPNVNPHPSRPPAPAGKMPGSALLSGEAWAAVTHSLGLTEHQIAIIQAVFDDAKESTIAADLGISPHTVHTHLDRLHRKLGVHDRVELVLRVVTEYLSLTSRQGSTLPPLCGRRSAGECPLHRDASAS